jgi:hypothetical protein
MKLSYVEEKRKIFYSCQELKSVYKDRIKSRKICQDTTKFEPDHSFIQLPLGFHHRSAKFLVYVTADFSDIACTLFVPVIALGSE